MLIGVVIDTSGLVPKQDSFAFDSLGKTIKNLFANPGAAIRNSGKKIIELSVPSAQKVNELAIQEDIAKGEKAAENIT
jgi:alpha-L-fucosidase